MKLNKSRILSLALVLAGNILYAFAVKLFLLPAGLMSSGTTGIALVVNRLTGIPLSEFILVFNICMLCLGWWALGRQFALTTVFSSLFYPLALRVLEPALEGVQLTRDPLLNMLFAGMGVGVAIGIVMRGGASTGGMDIPPLVLKKFFRIPVSVTLWVFDFFILLAQMTYNPPEALLYGILLIMITSFSLNKVLMMGTSRTEVKIVSSEAQRIREGILSRVDRGVTILHGEGGYLHQPTEVILSVVSNHEMPKIERLARSIDPNCFIIVSRVTEVWGRGFSLGKHYQEQG